MLKFKTAAIALGVMVIAEPAMAASCYQMWYARNEVYDNKGYCFKTAKAQAVFDNSDCWTSKPKLTKKERKYVKMIRQEEIAKGCVNGSG